MRKRTPLFLTLFLGACGGDATGPSAPVVPDEPAAPAAPVDPLDQIAAPAADEGFQIKLSSFKVMPGEEVYYCHRVPVPVAANVDLERIHTTFSKGSHHILIFNADAALPAAEGACSQGGFTLGVPLGEVARQNLRFLTGSQTPGAEAPQADTDFRGSGLGLALAAGGTLFMQQHFVNTGTTPIDARAVLNFWFAKQPVARHIESYFFFNPLINVPPHGEQEVAARCRFPAGTEVAGMVSHMHQHGVYFSAHRAMNDQLTEMLYESRDWAEPTPRAWAPGSMLKMSDGESIEYRCRFQNPGDTAIRVGESASDEMCMLIGFYVGGRSTIWGLPGLGATTPFGGENACTPVTR